VIHRRIDEHTETDIWMIAEMACNVFLGNSMCPAYLDEPLPESPRLFQPFMMELWILKRILQCERGDTRECDAAILRLGFSHAFVDEGEVNVPRLLSVRMEEMSDAFSRVQYADPDACVNAARPSAIRVSDCFRLSGFHLVHSLLPRHNEKIQQNMYLVHTQ